MNVNKTKIIVFRNGGKLASNEQWFYKASLIETVNFFKYLGFWFNFNGKPTKHFEECKKKVGPILAQTLARCRRLNYVFFRSAIRIFDAVVRSTLMYGADVWGILYRDELEIVHSKFLRSLLRLRMNTPAESIRLETGNFLCVYLLLGQRSVFY